MLDLVIYLGIFLGGTWLLVRVFLAGADHSEFDSPSDHRAGSRARASAENATVLDMIAQMQAELKDVPRKDQLAAMRKSIEGGFAGTTSDPEALGVRVEQVDAGGVPAEWVLAEGADPNLRLLYIHGGGFYIGSSQSHRVLTSALSRATGAAVLSVDYRLMPENRRIETITDCQGAYRWVLENGPGGASAPTQLFVAGDSAGGNLTLMLTAWARDEGLRQVDGAIALSPATDGTISSPSMTANIQTDPMLGPAIAFLVKLPRTIKLLIALIGSRINPRNPIVSPLFGDLSNLPPTLVQASECEMLLDDSRRYANKASAQGSPVTLQTWPGMVHVWQLFVEVLPEAQEALGKIGEFVKTQSAQQASPALANATPATPTTPELGVSDQQA